MQQQHSPRTWSEGRLVSRLAARAARALRASAKVVASSFAAERERWALWLSVFLGAGVAIYFALPSEPPPWLGAAGLVVVAAGAVVFRRAAHVAIVTGALGALILGFVVVQWRTARVAEPILAERLGPVEVVGRVTAVESLGDAARVILDELEIAQLEDGETPKTVRIRLGGRQPPLAAGMRIRVLAVLSPPSAPAAPGAFDFQRRSFFNGLGAYGFSMGSARLEDAVSSDGLRLKLARLRQTVSSRVSAALDGPQGAIAAALMTGMRGAIPAPLMAAIRGSGIAHLLAISGLHIGLVAGILFFGIRAGLALIPRLALRQPIKKWAAGAAIAGAFAYTVCAGATVPTQRAFLMIGLVLVGVLLDRRGLTMRLVAWASAVILIFRPESLLGASFQLSFVAVVALIAVYEAIRARRTFMDRGTSSWGRRAMLYLGGVALTTIVAGAATAPFALFHFNRLAAYGLAANLVAVPITALWVMPWAVAAYALMPFGLEAAALAPMGWGITIIIDVAETVAGWPGAVALLPAMPTWGLGVIAFGGLWLCLWWTRWRLLGAPVIALGLASVMLARPPDVLVDADGNLMAVRSADGRLTVSSTRSARFVRDVWTRRSGQEEPALAWPAPGTSADGRLRCDSLGCVYRSHARTVALVRRAQALIEDCWVADVVVSVVPVRAACPSARVVVDRFDLWRYGAHAIWLGEGDASNIRVESVNRGRGDRPWVLRPR
ncbi:MAG: ComEC/Rec2 family competence protein [Rhodospirillales bacterium]|nr:ComEC/Rec2 family competence protein [Rhodospirillales bacterium]